MVKKSRNKKRTVLAIIEGEKSEKVLLSKLIQFYLDPSKTNIKVYPKHGGTPASLIDIAILELLRNNHSDTFFNAVTK